MPINAYVTFLPVRLKKSLVVDGVIRGLHEVAKHVESCKAQVAQLMGLKCPLRWSLWRTPAPSALRDSISTVSSHVPGAKWECPAKLACSSLSTATTLAFQATKPPTRS